MALRDKIAALEKATDDFHGCDEMLLACGPISAEGQEISNRYFELREELSKIGLKLQSGSGLAPLEAAVYRWAVWQQAACHTASLLLADPSRGVEWEDSATIMEYLGNAENAMFEALKG